MSSRNKNNNFYFLICTRVPNNYYFIFIYVIISWTSILLTSQWIVVNFLPTPVRIKITLSEKLKLRTNIFPINLICRFGVNTDNFRTHKCHSNGNAALNYWHKFAPSTPRVRVVFHTLDFKCSEVWYCFFSMKNSCLPIFIVCEIKKSLADAQEP